MHQNKRAFHGILDLSIVDLKDSTTLASPCLFAGLRNSWIKIQQHLLMKKIEQRHTKPQVLQNQVQLPVPGVITH